MNLKKLTADLISDPRLWRLSLAISRNKMSVLAYSIVGEESAITCTIPFETDISESIKPLEDVVYDNQLLLQDFDRIDILLRTDIFSLIPSEIDDEALVADIFRKEHPESRGEFLRNDLPRLGAAIITQVDSTLIGFLRRTFFNPRIMNWIYPLCSYFGDKSRAGSDRKMFAHFRDNRLDIVAFHRGKLLMANTFAYKEPIDAFYFIMASRKKLDFNAERDPLMLVGDAAVRDELMPLARKYVATVLPVIFPSTMVAALKNSASSTPFPLILTPLCE